MKRFKDLLLSLFIFGSIVVIIFIILSFFNVKQTIEVGEDEKINSTLNDLVQRIDMLQDGECKDYLNDYVDTINEFKLSGKVKISTIYDYFSNYPTMKLYGDAEKKCKFTKDELNEYGVDGKYITLMVLPETIFNKYIFSYEFHIKDELRLLTESNADILTIRSIKFNQVEILKDYVTLAEMKEETNE